MAGLPNPFARGGAQKNSVLEDGQTNELKPPVSAEAERASRRRLIQGAAAAAAAVGAVYVKPSFHSFSLAVALAASGAPPPACGNTGDPCSIDSDCCSGNVCKSEFGFGVCCPPGQICF